MAILLDTKYLVIIIGAIVGVLIGSAGTYLYLNSKFATDTMKNSALFENLNHNYNDLEIMYDELSAANEELGSENDRLEQLNSELVFERNMYSNNYDKTYQQLKDLSEDLYDYRDTIEACSDTEKAIGKVLTLSEVQKVGSKVTEVTMSTKKKWLAYSRINDYLLNQITTIRDVPFPCITRYRLFNQSNDEIIVGLDLGEMDHQIQTPFYTMMNRQGDSDDQAVLECAMIQFYDHYIVNNQTKIYYCMVRFSDGSLHSFVIVPDVNNLICILDPAANYITSDNGWANADLAFNELNYYREHWASRGFYITDVELYEVRSLQGYFTMVCKTDLNGAVNFLSN